MSREPEKKKPEKKKPAKKIDSKKKKLSPEEKEKERKKEEIVIPAVMFAAIIIVMIVLIYLSLKTGDTQKAEDQYNTCSRQLTVRVATVLAAYRMEKGDYPESIQDLKDFLRIAEGESKSETPGSSETPGNSPTPGKSLAAVEKKLADVWQNFYCPGDHDKQTPSYIYKKPASDAPDDFRVMICRIHGDKSILTFKALKNLESPQK
jgi:hypothetical protein